MSAIQEIFRRFAPAYLRQFGRAVPRAHRRVIDAIRDCRTAALGTVCFCCSECGCTHASAASCGNRHCPLCQGRKSHQWLQRQSERQLPGPHFMLTFTVPEALREFLRGQQRIGYAALFSASAEAIKTLAKDPRFIGGDCSGFFGVLHTWGRQLQYHPHIHYVVPAGALDRASSRWKSAQDQFFLPVRALSRLFRGKFKAVMSEQNQLSHIPPSVWTQEWNVHCQAVPTAAATLRYLAPYVFKVAISDSRILAVNDDHVAIQWRKVGSTRTRVMHLDPIEFIRRFLTHVLPKGFMKVRYFGFMAPSSKIRLEQVRLSILLDRKFELPAEPIATTVTAPPQCRECGGLLRFLRVMRPVRTLHTGPPRRDAARAA